MAASGAARAGASQKRASSKTKKSYTKRISDNIAYALIVYTMMLIFLVAGAIKTSGTSVMPYIMLMLFVAVVIPLARKLEKKWEMLDQSELSDSSLNRRYNIDRVKLWIGTLVFPLFLMGVCTVISG